MSMFREKGKSNEKDAHGSEPVKGQVLLVRYLLNGIERFQRKWSDYMNKRTASLSRKAQLIWLFMFCVAGLFCIGWQLGRVIRNKEKLPLEVGTINAPALLPAVGKANVTPGIEEGIRHFYGHLDSLDEMQMDSLLNGREGLLDSLEQVEEWYNLKGKEDE